MNNVDAVPMLLLAQRLELEAKADRLSAEEFAKLPEDEVLAKDQSVLRALALDGIYADPATTDRETPWERHLRFQRAADLFRWPGGKLFVAPATGKLVPPPPPKDWGADDERLSPAQLAVIDIYRRQVAERDDQRARRRFGAIPIRGKAKSVRRKQRMG